MKHEPHEPIRQRKRERVGVLGSEPVNSQPMPRVLIRVPFVEAKLPSAQLASTPPGNSTLLSSSVKTTEHRPGSESTSTATTSFRIDSAHPSAPGPHLKPPAWIQQSGGLIAGVLQRKKLLAIGLIAGGLIAAIAFQQKSTNESVTENARPRRLTKGERHAALQRKSGVESMSSTATEWTSTSKNTAFESAKPRANGGQSNAASESSSSGPALTRGDALTAAAASNTPAKVEATANSALVNNDSLTPRMEIIQPPQSVSNLGGELFYIRAEPVYEARRDPAVVAPIAAPANVTTNRAMFDGGPGKLLPK